MKKLIGLLMVPIMMLAFMACQNNDKVNFGILHETATGWGYEGSTDDFVAILLGENGGRDDKSNANLGAYEIYKKYHADYNGTKEEFIDDLVHGRLNKLIDKTGEEIEAIKVLYVSNRQNPFVYSIFSAILTGLIDRFESSWYISVTEAKLRDDIQLSGYGFYIFENEMPQTLPTDGIVLLINPDAAPVNSGLVLGETITKTNGSALKRGTTGELSRIITGITSENITVSQYKNVASYNGYQALMFSGTDPIFLVKDYKDAKIAMLPFALQNSNLLLSLEFPTLMYNLFDYFLPRVGVLVTESKMVINIVSSKEDEMNEVLNQFNLSDAKELWTGPVDENFHIDRVVIIMKKTSSYPELELSHFGLDNGESLHYYFLKPSKEYLESNFRQMLVIYLKQHGREKVLEAINELEKLEFVKRASPSYIYGTQDN